MRDAVHDLDTFLHTLRRHQRGSLRIGIRVNTSRLAGFPSNGNIATVQVMDQPVTLHGGFESNQASVDDREDNKKNARCGVGP